MIMFTNEVKETVCVFVLLLLFCTRFILASMVNSPEILPNNLLKMHSPKMWFLVHNELSLVHNELSLKKYATRKFLKYDKYWPEMSRQF